LVVNPNAEVLIVRTTKWRGTWGVPGGKLDWGESLQEALLREFREEVALDLHQVRFALLQEAILDSQFHVPAHFVLVNYYAFSASTQVVPNEEIVEWVWLPPEQALSFPLNNFTERLVSDCIERNIVADYCS
jgi:ADP-ribose pyrophosphatase YjhB (NUDIX family)